MVFWWNKAEDSTLFFPGVANEGSGECASGDDGEGGLGLGRVKVPNGGNGEVEPGDEAHTRPPRTTTD